MSSSATGVVVPRDIILGETSISSSATGVVAVPRAIILDETSMSSSATGVVVVPRAIILDDTSMSSSATGVVVPPRALSCVTLVTDSAALTKGISHQSGLPGYWARYRRADNQSRAEDGAKSQREPHGDLNEYTADTVTTRWCR